MGCRNCEKGYCTFHEGSTKLATGLQYTKQYNVYDLKKKSMKHVELRDKDRKSKPYIEIEEKMATCTKCRRMEISNNYFVITRSGTANVCVCQFCVKTKYANEHELFDYVKSKLLSRYQGSDTQLKELLKY